MKINKVIEFEVSFEKGEDGYKDEVGTRPKFKTIVRAKEWIAAKTISHEYGIDFMFAKNIVEHHKIAKRVLYIIDGEFDTNIVVNVLFELMGIPNDAVKTYIQNIEGIGIIVERAYA